MRRARLTEKCRCKDILTSGRIGALERNNTRNSYTLVPSRLLNTNLFFFVSRRLFKNKKAPGVASSSLEMYLNRSQPVTNAYSQSLSGGGTGGEQHESPENQRRSPNLSVDLNSDLNSEGKKIMSENHIANLKSFC